MFLCNFVEMVLQAMLVFYNQDLHLVLAETSWHRVRDVRNSESMVFDRQVRILIKSNDLTFSFVRISDNKSCQTIDRSLKPMQPISLFSNKQEEDSRNYLLDWFSSLTSTMSSMLLVEQQISLLQIPAHENDEWSAKVYVSMLPLHYGLMKVR